MDKEAIAILEKIVADIKNSDSIPQGVGKITNNEFYADIEITLNRHIIIKLSVDMLTKL